MPYFAVFPTHGYIYDQTPIFFTATPRNFISRSSNPIRFEILILYIIMINSKRITQLARKWQKMAVMKRGRISFPTSGSSQNLSIPDKGHFVVYTADKTRFVVPLEYLSKRVFQELLRTSEEEFGLPGDGPIMLPCDRSFLQYVLSLARGCIPEDLEKALLTSLPNFQCSASSSVAHLGMRQQQTLISSY